MRAHPGIKVAVLAAVVIPVAAGCHSGSASNSAGSSGASASGAQSAAGAGSAAPSPPASAAAAPADGLTTCKPAALTMTLDDSQADGAAGSTYYPIDFTNTAATACVLAGYPGVSLVSVTSGAGRQIGAAALRNPQAGPAVVRLAPDGQAHAWLQLAAAGNFPDSTCRPQTAHGLRVYPPGDAGAGDVRHDFPACAGPTAPLLTVMPVRPGKGAQGTVP